MSNLVGNPADRFSHEAAHLTFMYNEHVCTMNMSQKVCQDHDYIKEIKLGDLCNLCIKMIFEWTKLYDLLKL